MQTIQITSGSVSGKETTYELNRVSIRKNLINPDYLIFDFEAGENNISKANVCINKKDLPYLVAAINKELSPLTPGLPTQISIQGKEWFDKVNDNSYHSVRVSVWYAGTPAHLPTEYAAPYQYGYGDHYLQTAGELLQSVGVLETVKGLGITRFCRENNIVLNHNISRNCKKAEVRVWGER